MLNRITNPKVHTFDSSVEAYDASQCDDDIANGDVLVVLSEDAIAILVEAWPVAISPEMSGESFHEGRLNFARVPSVSDTSISFDFSESLALAQKIKSSGLEAVATEQAVETHDNDDPLFDQALAAIDEPSNPSVDAAALRDIAFAVTVLRNDLGLDSDEALDLLVEQHLVPRSARSYYRDRYFQIAKHLRPFTDRVRAERVV